LLDGPLPPPKQPINTKATAIITITVRQDLVLFIETPFLYYYGWYLR